jgi:hypothetical protein
MKNKYEYEYVGLTGIELDRIARSGRQPPSPSALKLPIHKRKIKGNIMKWRPLKLRRKEFWQLVAQKSLCPLVMSRGRAPPRTMRGVLLHFEA